MDDASPTFEVGSDLAELVRPLELPMILVELDSFTIVSASEAALRATGKTASEAVGSKAYTMMRDDAEREQGRTALEAMRSGIVDFYGARRQLGPTPECEQMTSEWVRAVELDGRRYALVELAVPAHPGRRPLTSYLGEPPRMMAIGSADETFAITSVSEDTHALLGVAPATLIAHPLVAPQRREELARLFQTNREHGSSRSLALGADLSDVARIERRLCCILSERVGGDSPYCFILVPITDQSLESPTRTAQLEQHLLKIAAEVEASGILQGLFEMTGPIELPEIGMLTARQWDIVARLARGERVPTIAEELFVSQSTVRNYLSEIFKKFGVHSQVELLARLRRRGDSSS